ATDQQLNQLVGIKKLHAWRDEGRKAKDKKAMGKKGRLREWRKEVFGDASRPLLGNEGEGVPPVEKKAEGGHDGEGKKKRKKKKTKKSGAAVAEGKVDA
ncbi:hypothetical protein LTS18_010837, partial [Coniosporium uncinatum]